MKKLLFILPAITFSVLAFAQNNNGVKKTTEIVEWRFSNNTGRPVGGIMIEIVPAFKIEKGIANTQPVTLGGSVTHLQKKWLPCNFRVEMANHGVVKFDVQKTSYWIPTEMISMSFYFTRNGQQVGNIMSAKTDFTGTIPTQLGSL